MAGMFVLVSRCFNPTPQWHSTIHTNAQLREQVNASIVKLYLVTFRHITGTTQKHVSKINTIYWHPCGAHFCKSTRFLVDFTLLYTSWAGLTLVPTIFLWRDYLRLQLFRFDPAFLDGGQLDPGVLSALSQWHSRCQPEFHISVATRSSSWTPPLRCGVRHVKRTEGGTKENNISICNKDSKPYLVPSTYLRTLPHFFQNCKMSETPSVQNCLQISTFLSHH